MLKGVTAGVLVSVLVFMALMGSLDETAPRTTELASGPSDRATSSVAMPSARDAQAMAYDAVFDRVVLFGGANASSFCGLADTWVYAVANHAWQEMNPAVAPPGRCPAGMMAYDSQADRVVLFGGAGYRATFAYNDTWAYDLTADTWTNMNPAASPPARTGGSLVYDVRLNRLILFGGHRLGTPGNLAFNDTWTYDLGSNAWTQVATAVSPSLRAFPAMAYDVESDRVVLFGGETEPNSYADNQTWALDPVAETWAKRTPAASPAARFAAAATYDARANRLLVFGGTGYPDNSGRNDTWAYDFNADAWSLMDTAVEPSNRLSTMVYASNSDRTVLFGGLWPWPSGTDNQETWLLDRGNGTWTLVLPDTTNPTLTISSPADGATLNSTSVTVTGTASDNLGVASVDVRLDNASWIPATGTSSWSATMTLAEGANTIHARVTDTSGNTATSTVHVTVVTPAGGGLPVWIWPVVGVPVAGVAIAAYLAFRRRRKPVAESPSPRE